MSADPIQIVSPELPPAVLAGARTRRRGGWIWRRIGFSFLSLLVVSVLVFAATQALPGDTAQAVLGQQSTPERLASVRAELGLDKPLTAQYLTWIGGAVTGDLGRSLNGEVSVAGLVGERFVNTFLLFSLSLLIAIPLSIAIGSLTALHRDRPADNAVQATLLALAALPEFVIGLMFVLLFATSVFTLLPAVAVIPSGETALAHPDVIVLPVATLVVASIPYLSRMVRASTVDVLESPYIEMARLKGLHERRVLMVHALPNALAPTFQAIALMVAWMIGGIVVVESLFNYPGLGSLLTEAVAKRDIPVIQAVTLLSGVVVVLTNLLADVLTVLVSPRLRTRGT
jgi:peptide/nickel transport system permease protein